MGISLMFSATAFADDLGLCTASSMGREEIKGAIPGLQPTDSNPTLNECDELL